MLQTQRMIEEKYSKRLINKWIEEDIGDIYSFQPFIEARDRIKEYLSGSYYKSKNERLSKVEVSPADIAYQVIAVVASIENQYSSLQEVVTKVGAVFTTMNRLEQVKTGAEVIGLCKDLNIYEIIHAFDKRNQENITLIKPLVRLEDNTLQKTHMTQYLPPMLCSPLDWTNNINGGYLLDENHGSIILGKGNHHFEKQALDVINRLQEIAWELNVEMLEEPEGEYESLEIDFIDDPKEREKAIQEQRRIQQARKVYNLMLENGNRFFFVWKFDKRGRMYSQGYDINLQGSEYKKATIQFANTEYLEGVA